MFRRSLPLLLLCACDAFPPVACTEIGCSDGLTIELNAREGAFTPGTYTVAAVSDVDEACSFTIGGADDCAEGAGCVTESSCEAGFVLETGDDQVVFLLGSPDSLTLTVDRDGEILLEETFAPEYVETQPNGKNCPPTCRNASAAFEL